MVGDVARGIIATVFLLFVLFYTVAKLLEVNPSGQFSGAYDSLRHTLALVPDLVPLVTVVVAFLAVIWLLSKRRQI